MYGTVVAYRTPRTSVLNSSQCAFPIGVLSGYAAKRANVRENWGQNRCVFFVVGTTNGAWPEEEQAQHQDLILLDTEEVYHGEDSILSYKTAAWFLFAHAHFPNASYVLKTDDDCYVDVDGLRAELRRVEPDYWGKVWRSAVPIRDPKHKWHVSKAMWPEATYPDYCSGAGYVLSRKAVNCMATLVPRKTFLGIKDVATGAALRECGIVPTDTLLVAGTTLSEFAPNDASGKWLIAHNVPDMVPFHTEPAPPSTSASKHWNAAMRADFKCTPQPLQAITMMADDFIRGDDGLFPAVCNALRPSGDACCSSSGRCGATAAHCSGGGSFDYAKLLEEARAPGSSLHVKRLVAILTDPEERKRLTERAVATAEAMKTRNWSAVSSLFRENEAQVAAAVQSVQDHAAAAAATTQAPTSADDEQCRQRAPECVSALNVRRRWGKGVAADYNQSTCCRTHPVIREVVIDLMGALDKVNAPWFLEAGTMLGVVRHNNTQVPWGADGDLSVVFGGGVEGGSNATTMIPLSKIQPFMTKGLVALLPGQWKVHQVHKNHGYCIQYQFRKLMCETEMNGTFGGKKWTEKQQQQQQQQQQCVWSPAVDVFGYVWHAKMPLRFIGGALRKNFNPPKW
jgi:hypothetical protein